MIQIQHGFAGELFLKGAMPSTPPGSIATLQVKIQSEVTTLAKNGTTVSTTALNQNSLRSLLWF